MTCDSREFFKRYLRELEQKNISAVLSSSPSTTPEGLPLEVNHTVARADLGKLRRVQLDLAKQNGWALVQTFESNGVVRDTLLVNLATPGESLRLNASANDAGAITRRPLPVGICLAVLGSDGAGKSTLLARLQTWLQPCFGGLVTLHFRPAIFEKPKSGVVTNPHGKVPRNVAASWLKTGYYFGDNWLGWFKVVRPAKARGALVIFDRNFDDMTVDQRRYRLQGVGGLVRLLRAFLPNPDRTFVLTASAELLHQRKPELPVAELARQQVELRKLAARGNKYVLVSAEQAPEQVAATVWREVVTLMAAREESRS